MRQTARSQVVDLFALAISDGFASPEELALLYERGHEIGLGDQDVDGIIRDPDSIQFEPPATLVDAIARLYDLGRVLHADGVVDPREVSLMISFAKRFGIDESLCGKVVDAVVDELRSNTSRDELVQKLSKELGQ